MPAMVCHRRGYGVGSIYTYRFSDTEKPIFVGRDKYRLSDTMSRHVPPVSMDDAPESTSARRDPLDPDERAVAREDQERLRSTRGAREPWKALRPNKVARRAWDRPRGCDESTSV